MQVDEIIAYHHYLDQLKKKKKITGLNERKKHAKQFQEEEDEEVNNFDELFESDYFLLQQPVNLI